MKRKRLEPNSPEAVEAILRRIDSMTKEEWQYWIEKLSRAPEGVYDPWSEENWPKEKEWRRQSDDRAPVTALLSPSERKARERVLRRIENMTSEEWQRLIDELSHAPEGVYDPWSEENWPREKELRRPRNGATPPADGSAATQPECVGRSDSDETPG